MEEVQLNKIFELGDGHRVIITTGSVEGDVPSIETQVDEEPSLVYLDGYQCVQVGHALISVGLQQIREDTVCEIGHESEKGLAMDRKQEENSNAPN